MLSFNTQSNNCDRKVSIIYLKSCFSSFSCFCNLNKWSSIWITSYFRCYCYFSYYLISVILLTMRNQFLFHSWSISNQEISKDNSNILMQQQLLHLIYYYCLAYSQLILFIFKRFTCHCFVAIYLDTSSIIFIYIIVYFISIIDWCHRIIVPIF